MDIHIDKNSPYVNGKIVTYEDGTYTLDPPDNPLEYHHDVGPDIKHEVVQGQTLEQLSSRYYKTSSLWHRIATYNPNVWDFINLEPGSVIIIPNPNKFRT